MVANDFKRAILLTCAIAAFCFYAFLVPKDWLLGTRVVLLVGTFFSIVLYMDHQRTKWFFSVIAIGLAGSSLAMVFQAATNFLNLSQNSEPWLLLYTASVAAIIIPSGGNVAKPRVLITGDYK